MLGGLLIACLIDRSASEALAASLAAGALDRLPDVATEHGIIPQVARALQGHALPPRVAAELRRLQRSYATVHIRTLVDLRELAPRLEALLDGRYAVIKGPALAYGYYDPPMLRTGADLDILIAPADVDRVVYALAPGDERVHRELAEARANGVGEVSFVLPHGTGLDLHWSTIQEGGVRRDFAMSTEELLDRRVPVDCDGVVVPSLDQVDTVCYLALHATIGGGYRLIWSEDLHRVVTAGSLDWDAVTERSRQRGLGLVVATALARARYLLDTPVDDDVLDRLAPRRIWRPMLEWADRRRFALNAIDRRFRGQVLVRATRRSDTRSLAQLGRLLVTDVFWYVVTDPNHPWRRKQRPTSALGG